MEILHFKSQKERLAYLRGEFEEIIPQVVEEEPQEIVPVVAEPKKKASKKGKKKDDKVQA